MDADEALARRRGKKNLRGGSCQFDAVPQSVFGHASYDRRRYVIDVVRPMGIVGKNDLKPPGQRCSCSRTYTHLRQQSTDHDPAHLVTLKQLP